jgi:DNA helicase-2/ATP-dependent DNA helicase PcrA
LTDYLNQVTLSSDTDEMDDGNYVTLATVHAVKGLEFKCVFICGLEENILPVSRAVNNDEDMEEERRLMYVAITRAKERLYLTRSKSRYLYGKREPTMRSRFLKELASEVELPKETRPAPRGYSDWDDPESYGNAAYGGGRYASNDDYGGKRNNFGGGYGSYGGGYGGGQKQSQNITRTPWNGNSYGSTNYGGGGSYGGSYGGTTSYGSTSYGSQSKAKQSSGFVYGGVGKATKPTAGGKDLSVYQIGVRVKHPKFGVGVIVASRGVGSNMILDIAFEGFGIKQLSASLAPLTVV